MPDPAAHAQVNPPDALVVGRYDRGRGYLVNRPSGTRNWLLTWTVSGAGLFDQGGSSTVARPGDVVLLTPLVPHRYGTDPETGRWGFWWVHFQPRDEWLGWLWPHRTGVPQSVISQVPAGARRRIATTFARLHADARWSGVGTPATPIASSVRDAPTAVAAVPAARELAYTGLAAVLILAAASSEAQGAIDVRVRQAQATIIADPGGPHTVATLADRVALSTSRFAHLFTQQTGMTPMRAVRQARLTHAARLLEATELSINQVAGASGFSSPFHFSRAFRAEFGVPPRTYRRRWTSIALSEPLSKPLP